MDESKSRLKIRLSKIWQPPDFNIFFEKYLKKSSRLIKKNSVIFNFGEPIGRLYFIKRGFVKLYRISEEGRESTIYLYGPGSVLGVRALTSEDKATKHFAEAITDLEVSTIEREEYLDILADEPQYLIDLLHIFISRLNYTERRLESFILTDTTARVAYFLADCASRFGEKKDGQIILPLSLTHQRIAEFVGSFRETVTNSIQKLVQDGVININRGKVTILNINKLHKVAGL